MDAEKPQNNISSKIIKSRNVNDPPSFDSKEKELTLTALLVGYNDGIAVGDEDGDDDGCVGFVVGNEVG